MMEKSVGKHVFPSFFDFPLNLKFVPKLEIEKLPPCIIHHCSYFFELMTIMIVLYMICIILHDHLSCFSLVLLPGVVEDNLEV